MLVANCAWVALGGASTTGAGVARRAGPDAVGEAGAGIFGCLSGRSSAVPVGAGAEGAVGAGGSLLAGWAVVRPAVGVSAGTGVADGASMAAGGGADGDGGTTGAPEQASSRQAARSSAATWARHGWGVARRCRDKQVR